MKPDKINTYGIAGSSKIFELSIADTDSESCDPEHRFKKMEKANARLKKLVDEQLIQLEAIRATNARFLSIIAHDLRTPSCSVISILELLKESYTEYDKPAVDRFIKMATNSAYGTLTLLDNLLAWTSAKNKAINFNPVKVNLHELVLSEIDNLFIPASHKLITLEYSIPFELFLKADQQMAEVIFRNLIQNAIKYSYVGGEINVGAVVNEKFVEITVEDNGIGITDIAREELFTDSSNKSTKGTNNEYGNGLGLMLCKEFVEKHGGSIRIESEQGKGSRVNFTLPHYA